MADPSIEAPTSFPTPMTTAPPMANPMSTPPNHRAQRSVPNWKWGFLFSALAAWILFHVDSCQGKVIQYVLVRHLRVPIKNATVRFITFLSQG